MKIAIHKSRWGFSQDWITYCKEKGIPYKVVNCYDSDIIDQIKDCQALMWHHHHTSVKDKIFAHQLLNAIEHSGKRVFPNFATRWHFDDKVGQKYLLESIHAPLVPSYVFYDKINAIYWIERASFPKVFKLRGGAGSTNVKLVLTRKQAKKIINVAFGSGFPLYDKTGDLKERFRKYQAKKTDLKDLLKSIRRLFFSSQYARVFGKEKGYVLFQDFIPDNQFDIRVITIDKRAFAIKRLVRKGDFRASGSGFILYDKTEIDERCVQIAFNVTKKLNAQCVAYDFVFDDNQKPLIVEINYGFAHEAYFECPGYWDQNINWVEEKFNPAHWMVDLLLDSSSL